MKPPAFAYHAPRAVAEAVALLGSLDNARILAGGQSLMPMLNMRFVLPDNLIDINLLDELSFIRDTGDALELGALARQRDVEFSTLIRRRCPLLAEAIGFVGHRQTRNRGTIGGSLCHLDPAAEIPTVAIAMDATISIVGGSGVRQCTMAEFAQGYMTTCLDPDEMLTSVRLPLWPDHHGHCFLEFSRRHGDFAIVSVAVLATLDGNGRVDRASVTLGGVGAVPVRVADAEAALHGKPPSSAVFEAVGRACGACEAMEDAHVTAAYRRHLAATLGARAAGLALSRARRPVS